jgi:hypothetical protein
VAIYGEQRVGRKLDDSAVWMLAGSLGVRESLLPGARLCARAALSFGRRRCLRGAACLSTCGRIVRHKYALEVLFHARLIESAHEMCLS